MKEVLEAFDRFLERRHLHFEATVIGGAALIGLGLIERATEDVDCLDPPIPEDIKRASVDFAKSYTREGLSLKKDWLDNGPDTLRRDLPKGWRRRRIALFKGRNVNLKTLGRLDLLRTKLFAYCDRQEDLQDCLAFRPTPEEIKICEPWVMERDANPDWPKHVRNSLEALGEEVPDHGPKP